jgi:hypothetical protein
MTARSSVKNSHIEDDLILVLQKQTYTVKVNSVRLRIEKNEMSGRRKAGRQAGRQDGRP